MADRICVCGHLAIDHDEYRLCFGRAWCACIAFRDREQAINQAPGKCVEALDRHERKKRSPLAPFENLFTELDRVLAKERLKALGLVEVFCVRDEKDTHREPVSQFVHAIVCGLSNERDAERVGRLKAEAARDNEIIGALAWKARAERAEEKSDGLRAERDYLVRYLEDLRAARKKEQ